MEADRVVNPQPTRSCPLAAPGEMNFSATWQFSRRTVKKEKKRKKKIRFEMFIELSRFNYTPVLGSWKVTLPASSGLLVVNAKPAEETSSSVCQVPALWQMANSDTSLLLRLSWIKR